MSAHVADVRARSVAPGATLAEDVPGPVVAGTRNALLLSHVALPFAIDDPVYGREPADGQDRSLALGRLSPRGEKRC